MKRLLLALIVLSGGISFPTFAQEKSKLYNHAYSAPASLFHETDVTVASKLRALPPTLDGERRYDVLGWLEQQGVERKPGVSAILLERSDVVVVRGPAEFLELAGGSMETLCIKTSIKQINLSADLWAYESDGPLDPAKRPHNLAEIRARAGNSLKLLDSHALLTKSGNRVTGESHSAITPPPVSPASTPAPASPKESPSPKVEAGPFQDGSRGSVFDVESSLSPSGETIDFQLAYQARVAQPAGEPDIAVHCSSTGGVKPGQDIVVFFTTDSGGTANGKHRHRALTISAQILDEAGQPLDDAEATRKKHATRALQLIRRAQEGIVTE